MNSYTIIIYLGNFRCKWNKTNHYFYRYPRSVNILETLSMFILNLNIQKLIFCSCLVDSTDEVINELWTFINVRREEFQKSCSVCCPCPLVHSQKNQTIYYPAQQRIIYTFFSKGKEAEKNSFVHYNVSKFLLPQSFI